MEGTAVEARYDALADAIKRTVEINRLLGITTENTLALRTTSFYTSHEALLLGYEQALTRRDELMSSGDYVATSGHFLWIGDRTRQPDGAHVEFCRGIVNPIGMKCGPSLQPDELLRLIDILNPKDEPGRLTLICRFGADKVEKHLPGPDPRGEEGRPHGGVGMRSHARQHHHAGTGYKTRPFESIVSEVQRFFDIHRAEGTYPGGVHIEMTGQNVTECTGGAGQDFGSRPGAPVRHRLRPAPQCGAVAGAGFSAGREAEAGAGERCRRSPRRRRSKKFPSPCFPDGRDSQHPALSQPLRRSRPIRREPALMASHVFQQVDVFTAVAFKGNPLAVVIGADQLDGPAHGGDRQLDQSQRNHVPAGADKSASRLPGAHLHTGAGAAVCRTSDARKLSCLASDGRRAQAGTRRAGVRRGARPHQAGRRAPGLCGPALAAHRRRGAGHACAHRAGAPASSRRRSRPRSGSTMAPAGSR